MQNHSEQENRQYAGFWIRFAAHLVDFIIVMLALEIVNVFMLPVTTLLEDTPLAGEIIFQYTLTDIVEYILTTAYFVIMTYVTGATLGKKLLKLKVISVKGDGKLRLFDVIYRETVGRYLSDAFGGIGYLVIAFNDEKKAIHDMLCDTRVVEVRRKQVTPVRTAETSVADMIPRMVEEQAPEERSISEEQSMPEAQSTSEEQIMPEEQATLEAHVQEQWKQIIKGDS